jgi:hypothetical protein
MNMGIIDNQLVELDKFDMSRDCHEDCTRCHSFHLEVGSFSFHMVTCGAAPDALISRRISVTARDADRNIAAYASYDLKLIGNRAYVLANFLRGILAVSELAKLKMSGQQHDIFLSWIDSLSGYSDKLM